MQLLQISHTTPFQTEARVHAQVSERGESEAQSREDTLAQSCTQMFDCLSTLSERNHQWDALRCIEYILPGKAAILCFSRQPGLFLPAVTFKILKSDWPGGPKTRTKMLQSERLTSFLPDSWHVALSSQ